MSRRTDPVASARRSRRRRRAGASAPARRAVRRRRPALCRPRLSRRRCDGYERRRTDRLSPRRNGVAYRRRRSLRFIGPSLPFIEGGNAINSNSVAFVLQYGTFRMLFTGDAGSESEERFLQEGVDLHADVLKVGHHGSAYGSSPGFIAAVAPRYAIVSVGRHNLFGHPAPSTLATLRRFGARVYRTDEDGAVTILPTDRTSGSRAWSGARTF